MEGRKRSSGTLAAAIVLPLFVALVFQTAFVGEAAALTWTQTTEADFESGTTWNVDTASSPGNVTLMSSETEWVKYESNPVLTPAGGWNSCSVGPGSVLWENGTYRFWFEGNSCATGAFGIATSTDGKEWTQYPGNPVFTPQLAWEGNWVLEPYVLREANGTFSMWYRGGETLSSHIGYAWSPDGVTWNRATEPVLSPSPGWSGSGVFAPSVLVDEAGVYHMWYEGFDGSVLRIGYANSTDPVNWTPWAMNPLALNGPFGSSDFAVGHPHVLRNATGFQMLYGGCSDGSCGGDHINLAFSGDGLTWTKHPNNPVISPGGTPATLPRQRGFDILYGWPGAAIGLATRAYPPQGSLVSPEFEAVVGSSFVSIVWSTTVPTNTRVLLAYRTSDDATTWTAWSMDFDTGSVNLSSAPRSRFFQWRATLESVDGANTPILHDVTLEYALNGAPASEPLSPIGCLSSPRPTFTWAFRDPEGDSQASFHMQVDDAMDFSSPEVDITIAGSANAYDLLTPLADGTYWWRVETADVYGLWSGFVGSLGFGVDTLPPVTGLSIGSPSVPDTAMTFVTSSSPITLTAADDGCAGLASTEYRLFLAGYWTVWQPYDGSFTLPDVGALTVEFRSSDGLGNTETAGNVSLLVDDLPPTTSFTVGAPRFDLNGVLYVATSTGITLSASDSGSGVDATLYSIDGSPWNSYGAPFTISGPTRPVTIEAYSIDALGNAETPFALPVFVDADPPTTAVTVLGPSYESGGVTYITSASRLVLLSSDTGSGVGTTRYRLDGGAWIPYTVPIELSGEGPHTLETSAVDRVGNAETAPIASFYLDDTLPATTLEIGTPRAGTNPTVVTSATTFTLSASDAESGVGEIYYSLDGGPRTFYSAPFTLVGQPGGLHVLGYGAKDNLGSWENSNVLTVFLDDTPPTADAGPDLIVPKGSTVVLVSASTDDFAIAGQVWTFTFEGNPVALSGPVVSFRFDRAGTYTITLTVTDLVGHAATDTANVTVWNRPPVASLSANPTSARTGVSIQLDASVSADEDGSIEEYCFDFGDSSTICGPSPTASHIYASGGTYDASVAVTDDDGATGADTTSVFVINRAPIADAGSDRDSFKRLVVTLDGSHSSDPEGAVLTFSWNEIAGPVVTLAGANSATASFAPTVAGTYVFVLGVSDGQASGEDTVAITVSNRAPSITGAVPLEDAPSLQAGERETFTVTAADQDGDLLTYSWTVNGALAGSDATFTLDRPAGAYLVNLTVSDGEAVAWREWTVTVAPIPLQPTLDVRDFSLILAIGFLIVMAYLLRRTQRGKAAGQMAPEEAPQDEEVSTKEDAPVEEAIHDARLAAKSDGRVPGGNETRRSR